MRTGGEREGGTSATNRRADTYMKHVDPGTGLGGVWIHKQCAVFRLDEITLLMRNDSVSSNGARALSANGEKNVKAIPITCPSQWGRALVSSNVV